MASYTKVLDALTLDPKVYNNVLARISRKRDRGAKGENWIYLHAKPKCRTSACLIAIRDKKLVRPRVSSLIRWTEKSPLVWRSDAPLGAESTAGVWCALALRAKTGCAVLLTDHNSFLETAREAGALLQRSRYLVGLELPWHEQVMVARRCSVSLIRWLFKWNWTLASTELAFGRNPLATRLGEALKLPAFSVSTGFLHGGTRAETLNLSQLMWTYRTLLDMLVHEKKQRPKKAQPVLK